MSAFLELNIWHLDQVLCWKRNWWKLELILHQDPTNLLKIEKTYLTKIFRIYRHWLKPGARTLKLNSQNCMSFYKRSLIERKVEIASGYCRRIYRMSNDPESFQLKNTYYVKEYTKKMSEPFAFPFPFLFD